MVPARREDVADLAEELDISKRVARMVLESMDEQTQQRLVRDSDLHTYRSELRDQPKDFKTVSNRLREAGFLTSDLEGITQAETKRRARQWDERILEQARMDVFGLADPVGVRVLGFKEPVLHSRLEALWRAQQGFAGGQAPPEAPSETEEAMLHFLRDLTEEHGSDVVAAALRDAQVEFEDALGRLAAEFKAKMEPELLQRVIEAFPDLAVSVTVDPRLDGRGNVLPGLTTVTIRGTPKEPGDFPRGVDLSAVDTLDQLSNLVTLFRSVVDRARAATQTPVPPTPAASQPPPSPVQAVMAPPLQSPALAPPMVPVSPAAPVPRPSPAPAVASASQPAAAPATSVGEAAAVAAARILEDQPSLERAPQPPPEDALPPSGGVVSQEELPTSLTSLVHAYAGQRKRVQRIEQDLRAFITVVADRAEQFGTLDVQVQVARQQNEAIVRGIAKSNPALLTRLGFNPREVLADLVRQKRAEVDELRARAATQRDVMLRDRLLATYRFSKLTGDALAERVRFLWADAPLETIQAAQRVLEAAGELPSGPPGAPAGVGGAGPAVALSGGVARAAKAQGAKWS